MQVVTEEARLSGEDRNWPYSGNEVVVRQIQTDDNPNYYPTISGDEIGHVLITDYKLQIYLKDKTKPSLIFILKDDVIAPAG